eukprot:TRINITY_DN28536_c0_g1_i1.p1 TRINITY_DN28536_c0_g1~~TRINITY_DN28536_c0_g1_i1.p1  ORF type:complete len:652 (-),score=189.54 TRINITY_DN28536_c0_g1_i1:118-2073(-)
MASVLLDFEILPEDGHGGGSSVGDRPAAEVFADLRRQLADPKSGFASRFSPPAALVREGRSLEELSIGQPPSHSQAAALGSSSHLPPPPAQSLPIGSGVWGQQPHHAPSGGGFEQPPAQHQQADWRRHPGEPGLDQATSVHQGLTNVELVDRIALLERQLAQSALGPPAVLPPSTASVGGGGGGGGGGMLPSAAGVAAARPAAAAETQALEEKCVHLQRRLEVAERELRDTQAKALAHKAKLDQVEQRLLQKEQLIVHAKDMWMKENVRANKFAEALTVAEQRMEDQERRLSDALDKYARAQEGLRQLQTIVPGPYGGIGVPATGGHSGGPERGSASVTAAFAENFPTSKVPSWQMVEAVQGALDIIGGVTGDTNSERFRRLCSINDAILHEDESLQIGVKAQYVGNEAQVAVYFGNKANAPLSAFSVQYMVREQDALRLTAAPVPQTLQADTQIIQRLSVTLREPFVEAPWLRIQYLLPDASPRRHQIRFPVVLSKFMVGRDLSSSDFFSYWRQQNFVLNEATSVVHLDTGYRRMSALVGKTVVLGGSLRLQHGIDSNPDNFVLVGQLVDQQLAPPGGQGHRDNGYYPTASPPSGDRGLVLLRVEIGTGKFEGKARVVARSADAKVAKAICETVAGEVGSQVEGPAYLGA